MNYRMLLQRYWQYLVGAVVVLLILICSILFYNKSENEVNEEISMVSTGSSESFESESISQQIYVDIKGAVKKPGMYEGMLEMRVWDAVMLAGGVREDADTKQVNFSERIVDQMVIYVPTIGEEVQELTSSEDSEDGLKSTTNKINLNKANEAELTTLTGIGQKKAQEIIRYREENGGFKSIEELKNISGFGEKTFEKLKDSISV
ncbi:helix-hairpin-helix domain-containing protein [Enterococcus sp. 5H]|uniref:helix-hairpin-helix domain-containing protein n=1 Tax=Enterococcus sp. 5H TaxID=1229490 RepID=UPI00230481C7|nr:helix-hairpin-helix domain-containing protein [Enterococcus sp. 5H]MDA9470135.1 Late competence protein ComEA, DNA receptor [Enterococcus sp. 5H]